MTAIYIDINLIPICQLLQYRCRRTGGNFVNKVQNYDVSTFLVSSCGNNIKSRVCLQFAAIDVKVKQVAVTGYKVSYKGQQLHFLS